MTGHLALSRPRRPLPADLCLPQQDVRMPGPEDLPPLIARLALRKKTLAPGSPVEMETAAHLSTSTLPRSSEERRGAPAGTRIRLFLN